MHWILCFALAAQDHSEVESLSSKVTDKKKEYAARSKTKTEQQQSKSRTSEYHMYYRLIHLLFPSLPFVQPSSKICTDEPTFPKKTNAHLLAMHKMLSANTPSKETPNPAQPSLANISTCKDKGPSPIPPLTPRPVNVYTNANMVSE